MHRWIFFLFCLMALALGGCSTTSQKDDDGISEAFSKPGKSSYRVAGKRYQVLKTSKNYEERGIASWYGKAFHAKRTSSGEHFNMLGMTAAHKTLPLATHVEVTNLANGKKVIVKVNDRGPFQTNRLIDLSYSAAKKIGMLGRGTAYVDVKAIDSRHLPADVPVLAENKKLSTAIMKTHLASRHHPSKHLYQAQRRSKKTGIHRRKIAV